MSKLTAILAWGSLIWDPKDLEYNKQLGWVYDGPVLPIEFARISKNGRLTLVITENGTFNKTFYTFANMKLTFEEAIENLRKREGCNKKDIGFYKAETDEFHCEDFKFKEEIRNWSSEKKIKNIIWTDLPEKWSFNNEKDETVNVNPNERIEYLKNLAGKKKELAEKYIRNAPKQVKTKYRNLIEQELDWTPTIENNKPYVNELVLVDHRLTFSKMGSIGEFSCLKCYHTEMVASYTRLSEGYQCQSCGKFHNIERSVELPTCNCGGELERNKPLFCPKCKSFSVKFSLKYFG
ncbi:Protein of unknown function [Flavobacterium indicum GPTSA100-9 = DSM 17447]|uniref:Uncharacterized protein n=1 Tax=Flavobacterium indicum (strain DSM 17447 / CIP 109464 / GPTSA100-9) TaxID=1094466 RepID=H8XTY3_FLAIG|nr:hypothetical protein [Flavobacterium indicum]CCG53713.1 Protein of unknown function [Flavobacterium indicum GPTSA100-9 = DSM 17447]